MLELAAYRFLEARWSWAHDRHASAWEAAWEAIALYADGGPDDDAERAAVEDWLAAHPAGVGTPPMR